MKKNIQARSKHVLLSIVVLGLVVGTAVLTIPRTHAQEINPAPGSYSYGSTSEYSAYQTLSAETLASTGQDQSVLYVVIIGSLVVGGLLLQKALRR